MRPGTNPARFTGRCRLPDEDICRLYRTLRSTDAVAARAGCSSFTVLKVLRRCGEPVGPAVGKGRRGRRKALLLTDAEISRRYAAGESLTALAKAADACPDTIRRVLKSHTIPLRSAAEATRLHRKVHGKKPTSPPDP
jgi:hypothetical protein